MCEKSRDASDDDETQAVEIPPRTDNSPWTALFHGQTRLQVSSFFCCRNDRPMLSSFCLELRPAFLTVVQEPGQLSRQIFPCCAVIETICHEAVISYLIS